MKANYRTLAVFGAAVLSLVLLPKAAGQCGVRAMAAPASWHEDMSATAPVRLLRASFVNDRDDDADDAAIVGFWHVKLFSNGDPKIEIDAGYSQFHSDRTEILNSGGHSPASSSFCLGVWKRVGERMFKVNHLPIAWTPTGSALVAIISLREEITVDADGNHFEGTFTSQAFDPTGTTQLGPTVTGTITGTRIQVDTPVESLF